MLDMKIAYPEFVPNQILTNTQLNQLREHLEQEDRLTRLRLAGTGIVCGLHGRKVTAPAHGTQIVLGYGVTSDGELLELCSTTTYTHYRDYADPDRDEENKLRYLPWRKAADPTQQLDILELIPKEVMEGDDPPAATAFTAATLGSKTANRVLVLYLEHQPVDLNSCLVTSCDNKGRNINVNVRALLVLKADLTAAAGCAMPAPIHRIPRHHTKGVPQPGNTVAQIRQAFSDIVSENAATVSANIKTLFDAYAPFLDLKTVGADPLANKLTGGQIAQYRYGALLDFASAYNEAAAGAYTLLKECCPAGTFPRHLMLGVLDGSAGEGFRNEFVASPLRNVMHGETARVRDLFTRLEKMIDGLVLGNHPAAASIRPSHSAAHTLGRRAQPYYFNASVTGVWRPRPRCTVDAEWPWLHPAAATGLGTDYAEATLLRIEGHVGDPCQAALADIVQKRDQGNAEFHVLCSYVEDGAPDEKNARSELVALLEKPREALEAARKAFESFITKREGDVGPIVALSKEQGKWLAEVGETSRGWVDLRKRRVLYCDTAALAYDYLEARGELLCLAGRVRAMVLRLLGDLDAIEDEALVGAGMEGMLLGIEYTLVDRLVASVLAEPDRWAAADEVSEIVKNLAGTRVEALRSALRFFLLSLVANLQRPLESALPPDLSEFDYDVFAYFFRILLADLREFWHWTRALGFQPAGAATETGRKLGDAPLHAADAEVLAADWLAPQGCQLARLATASVAFEAARARDVSLFRNLARIDGLEHLAGVSKGGTFVLVCDKASNDGTVAADFSLDGCLPCCCDVDVASLCLPPLALPDVRVVTLEPIPLEHRVIGFQAVDLEINVAANDCDLNGAATTRTIELLSATSERGAKLEADAQRGVVRYHMEAGKPLPSMIDRFSYRLRVKAEKCEGEAIGRAIVIFTVKPVLVGRIQGIVWRENGERGDDAIVTIVETGESLMTSGIGEFAFENIRRGEYSLFATQDEMKSDVVTAVVEGGRTAFVNLILKETAAATGNIMVRVRDASGSVIPGAKVTLTSEGAAPRVALTNDKGVAAFLNLPPATYVGKVEMTGLAVGTTPPIELAAGQSLAVDVELTKPSGVTVRGGLVEHVATTRNITLLDANVAVRKVLTDRHAKHILTFNTATDDPRVLRSEEYVRAARLLAEGFGPEATDEAVAAAYQETSAALAAAARQATGDTKTAYQKTLTAISGAYLDRIALSNPKTLSADASTEVKAVVRTLKNAEVPVGAVQTTWEGGALKESIDIGSADAINRLLV